MLIVIKIIKIIKFVIGQKRHTRKGHHEEILGVGGHLKGYQCYRNEQKGDSNVGGGQMQHSASLHHQAMCSILGLVHELN